VPTPRAEPGRRHQAGPGSSSARDHAVERRVVDDHGHGHGASDGPQPLIGTVGSSMCSRELAYVALVCCACTAGTAFVIVVVVRAMAHVLHCGQPEGPPSVHGGVTWPCREYDAPSRSSSSPMPRISSCPTSPATRSGPGAEHARRRPSQAEGLEADPCGRGPRRSRSQAVLPRSCWSRHFAPSTPRVVDGMSTPSGAPPRQREPCSPPALSPVGRFDDAAFSRRGLGGLPMSSRRLRSNLSGQKVGQPDRLTRRHHSDGDLDQPPPHT
jgi:hypothetical protein